MFLNDSKELILTSGKVGEMRVVKVQPIGITAFSRIHTILPPLLYIYLSGMNEVDRMDD